MNSSIRKAKPISPRQIADQQPDLYSGLPDVPWPALPARAGAAALSVLFQLDQTQWWSPDSIAKQQWSQLNLVTAHAQSTVPFYRERLESLGWSPEAPITADSWRKMPVLTRAEVQDAGESLWSTAVPPDHGKPKVLVTSGSTGRPLKTLTTDVAQLFWRCLSLRDHLWHGRDLRLKHAVIRQFPQTGPSPIIELREESWGMGVFRTGPIAGLHIDRTVSEQAEWLLGERPAYLLTYPSNLRALAVHFLQRGEGLPGLLEVRTVGELIPEGLRQLCREAWNVPLVDMYTSQEAGYIAIQCPGYEHYHLQSENLLVEVLDDDDEPCAPGDRGRVVISTLHNLAMPLLRYEVGDFADVGDPCPCGRGLPVITRIVGRQRNVFARTDGDRMWPTFGDTVSFRRAVGPTFPPMLQYQVIQHALDAVEMKLVVERRLTPEEFDALHAHLQNCLRSSFALTVTYVDEIPRSPGGKFEDFRSEVST